MISFASNGDLQSLLRSRGSLSLACSRYYTAQLVDTVTWIHSRGILHRDIKPENILLDDQWRMKLTDFGSAKLMRRGQDGAFVEDTENTRSFVGSPQFVSPELLLNEYKYACKRSVLLARSSFAARVSSRLPRCPVAHASRSCATPRDRQLNPAVAAPPRTTRYLRILDSSPNTS